MLPEFPPLLMILDSSEEYMVKGTVRLYKKTLTGYTTGLIPLEWSSMQVNLSC